MIIDVKINLLLNGFLVKYYFKRACALCLVLEVNPDICSNPGVDNSAIW